jgi:tetratricopeptide (TPR) repeat protein
MPEPARRKLLLVGWDAADWRVIHPLLEAGLMPTLQSLIERGVMGNLATLHPPLSPMLWTSIATGKRADRHGIHGFIEPAPDGSGARPVSSTTRTTRALWNILTLAGKRSQVYNFFASHPAEPVNGLVVSDLFSKNDGSDRPLPTLADEAIHPLSLRAQFEPLRVSPNEIAAGDLAPFIPKLGQIPVEETGPVVKLRSTLADCASVHAASTHGLATQPWDFAAVYHDAIDHTCHSFMQLRPPKLPWVNPRRFEWYSGVVDGMYRFHDMMLQSLLEIAGDDTTVMIVSDHGFHSGKTRPKHVPGHIIGPAVYHREMGVFVLAGPGIRRDERVYGASLLDVAPTILALFGLPVGADMDGRVLVNAFEQRPAIERIESWDRVKGDAGEHPADKQLDPFAAQQAMQQLIDLGYIAAPGPDATKNADVATSEAKFNLACVHLDADRPDRAAPLLEELRRAHPEEARYTAALAQAMAGMNRLDDARRLLVEARQGQQESAGLLLSEAGLEIVAGRVAEAGALLARAAALEPENLDVHLQIGTLHLSRRDYAAAGVAFAAALAIDPESATAHYGLSRVALHEKRDEDALESALRAVSLVHHFPRAHFTLGVACARLGMTDRAIRAMQTCLSVRPNTLSAHRHLATLYRKAGQPELSFRHREIARQLSRAFKGGVAPVNPEGTGV